MCVLVGNRSGELVVCVMVGDKWRAGCVCGGIGDRSNGLIFCVALLS